MTSVKVLAGKITFPARATSELPVPFNRPQSDKSLKQPGRLVDALADCQRAESVERSLHFPFAFLFVREGHCLPSLPVARRFD